MTFFERRPDAEERLARGLLLSALAVGALLRAWLALADQGIAWPDEIYQSIEPAHRLVYGRGLLAWEFAVGARGWTLPGLIASVLALLRLSGVTEPTLYLPILKLLFAAVGVATAWATARLARALGAGPLPSAVAGALWALAGPAIYFAPRGLSEPLCALPLTLGLARCWPRSAPRRDVWVGSAWLVLAVLLRLQVALVCAGVLLVLAVRRDWRRLRWATAVLLLGAVADGLLDWASWGRPFQAALQSWKFNVTEGRGALWGVADWTYYPRVLARSMPGVAGVCAIGTVLAWRRAGGLVLVALGFAAVHAAIPHKELRFLVPVLPVFAAFGGLGLEVLRSRLGVRALCAAALLPAAFSAATFHRLTFGDLGMYEGPKSGTSAYDDFGSVNRLLLRASSLPSLCGLKVEAVHMAWAGGYSTFHRDAPLYSHLGPPRSARHYDVVLTVPWTVPPSAVLARDGPVALARLFAGPCVPDPGFSFRLP